MSYGFLNEFEGTKKSEQIAAIGEWRKKGIVSRCFPGTPVGGMGYNQAIEVAGAGFTVWEEPIRGSVTGLEVPSHKAIIHGETGDFVSCVGKDFGTIQHIDALDGLRPLMASQDISLESMYVSDDGASVIATALLGFSKVFQAGRDHADALAHFVRIRNSHGFGAAQGGLYTLRLTCLNGQTSIAALDKVSINHTKYANRRLPNLHSSVLQAINAAKKESEEFQQMAENRMRLEEFIILANDILTGVRGEADTDRKKKRRESDVTDLADLFCDGDGNLGETDYDCYNSFTQWLTPRQELYQTAKKFAAKFEANESGQGRLIRRRVREALLNR